MRTVRPVQITIAVLSVALAATGCAAKSTSATPAKPTGTVSSSPAAANGADAAKAALPADIKAKGVITVATDPSYPPIESFKAGTKEIVGLDPDLAAAMGDVLGVKFELKEAVFDGIIAGLKAKRFDIAMSAMSDTKKRQATVSFVDYFNAGTSIMVAKGNPKGVTGIDGLCGLTVAAENGTVQITQAEAAGKACTDAGKAAVTVSGFPDQNGAITALRSGRAQAVLADSPVNAYSVEQSKDAFEVVAGAPTEPGPYGIAIPKDNADLVKAIQLALQEVISSGKYDEILTKYNLAGGELKVATVNGGKS